jgi:rhamnulose-1-phosphate aldolase
MDNFFEDSIRAIAKGARSFRQPTQSYHNQIKSSTAKSIMSLQPPYPDLDEFLEAIGEAGARLCEIDASEGAAGNISIYLGWDVDPRRKFPVAEEVKLPIAVPELAGGLFLVTGSGRRLREIRLDPAANLGAVRVLDGGATAQLYTSPRRLFTNLTSEFNSHLAVHQDQIAHTQTNFNAVVHAQPLHLTYLSHIPAYQDERYLNRHILRWEPEAIVNFPEGIGLAPFRVPGSPELMQATLEGLRQHRVVVWAKHGVVARSNISVKRAVDAIEYAETGAHYEYLNLANREQAAGLTDDEIRAICRALHIQQNIF